MEWQRSISVSPAQAALLSMGRKRICIFSSSFPKAISRLTSPARNFPAVGLMPTLRRSQALRQEAITDPQPLCHLRGPADRPTIFSSFPHPRGGRGCVEGLVVALAQVWHKKQQGFPGTCAHSIFSVIITQLVRPSTARAPQHNSCGRCLLCSSVPLNL